MNEDSIINFILISTEYKGVGHLHSMPIHKHFTKSIVTTSHYTIAYHGLLSK